MNYFVKDTTTVASANQSDDVIMPQNLAGDGVGNHEVHQDSGGDGVSDVQVHS